jgi:competence protein ComEA
MGAGARCGAVLALAGWSGSAQGLPDAPGRDLFQTVCSECHELTKVIGQHKTKDEWQAKVTEMLQEDQDVTQQEREIIVNYLAANFPKLATVNVNRADAKELQTALHLPSKVAEAIVGYRSEKGNFRTLEDLKQVPGLDAATVDGWKGMVEF